MQNQADKDFPRFYIPADKILLWDFIKFCISLCLTHCFYGSYGIE